LGQLPVPLCLNRNYRSIEHVQPSALRRKKSHDQRGSRAATPGHRLTNCCGGTDVEVCVRSPKVMRSHHPSRNPATPWAFYCRAEGRKHGQRRTHSIAAAFRTAALSGRESAGWRDHPQYSVETLDIHGRPCRRSDLGLVFGSASLKKGGMRSNPSTEAE